MIEFPSNSCLSNSAKQFFERSIENVGSIPNLSMIFRFFFNLDQVVFDTISSSSLTYVAC